MSELITERGKDGTQTPPASVVFIYMYTYILTSQCHLWVTYMSGLKLAMSDHSYESLERYEWVRKTVDWKPKKESAKQVRKKHDQIWHVHLENIHMRPLEIWLSKHTSWKKKKSDLTWLSWAHSYDWLWDMNEYSKGKSSPKTKMKQKNKSGKKNKKKTYLRKVHLLKTYIYIYMYTFFLKTGLGRTYPRYGVTLISRLLKLEGLFCRIYSLL